MLPQTITHLLDRLRRRELLLALAWCAAKWFAVIAAVVVACCAIDNWVDLYRDTPTWLRTTMTILVLFVLAPVALVSLVLTAARSRLPNEEVALWVEQSKPLFRHRLISAVQFDRDGAKTEGMSGELIAAVTRQAGQMAADIEPAQVLDDKRLRRAAWLAGPVLGVSLVLVLAKPMLAGVLLQRLFSNDDLPIPRSITLWPESGIVEIWPSGEEGIVRVLVEGGIPSPEKTGEVRIVRDDGQVSYHILEFATYHPRDPAVAIYTARVPPSDVAFGYSARLADGRTRNGGVVEYVPRPVVQSLQSWVQLPASVGLRPGKVRYEEAQKGGDIVHRLPGSWARLRIETQKAIRSATAHVLGQSPRSVSLTLSAKGLAAVGAFPIRPGDTGYEVEVRDEHNFANADRPRRTITSASLELPEVLLLPEYFAPDGEAGSKEDYEAEGVPVAAGSRFRLEYTCGHRYGLSHAQLRFRVLPRGAAKEESGAIDASKFQTLPLGPLPGRAATATAQALREFSTRGAAGPDALPDTEGGGAYDFELAGVPDGQGGRLKLTEGDRIQFFVEVFGKADALSPGRSVVREKEVVSDKAYTDWFIQKINLTERTRELEERQRGTAPPGGER